MSDSALQVEELEIEGRVAKLGTRVTFVSPEMLADSDVDSDIEPVEDASERVVSAS